MPTPSESGDKSPHSKERAQTRWAVYWVLIALAAGSMVGRILSVDSVDRQELQRQLGQRNDSRRIMRPFLSSNDRSRWCTIRALVEHGTYEIDKIIFVPKTVDHPNRPPSENHQWDTLDKVRHKNREGKDRFYSSKPPLLPTLLAAEYWVIYQLTGATLEEHPYDIGRFMLITTNVIPLIVAFWLLGRLVERFGTTDWGRIFVMGAATFGTFLTTFAVTLNNHIPAAVSATVALYALVRIGFDGERHPKYFLLAGLFAAFTAANELPALAFFAAVTVVILWRAPKQAILAYLPAAAVVAVAFFGTNLAANDSWRPAYAHREKGDNWYEYTYQVHSSKGPITRESYWMKDNRQGVDRGEEGSATYALHVLVGHHGIFSLTPVWLLCLFGVGLMCASGQPQMRQTAIFVATITTVCLVFYLLRPQVDRNYGGMTSGFRWMFWFAPLWLVTMVPAADRLSGVRWQRIVALVLLGASALSVSYPTWNPWTHPWIYEYLRAMGVGVLGS